MHVLTGTDHSDGNDKGVGHGTLHVIKSFPPQGGFSYAAPNRAHFLPHQQPTSMVETETSWGPHEVSVSTSSDGMQAPQTTSIDD